ncbi:MAG: chromosome segregation protein SMC [Candidatus Fermentimicrarchaeum limneticum]|uniref:Chromosome segregation protein SMC n=1 Tax=Fermentimicrarchaeum limneticum TaxID=2795018 RepID=A0A7D6BES2_FERL1|nr:MAG: chromosome segregation protein SMC [Candidatus Fermentimicrarchaeum limneticum]
MRINRLPVNILFILLPIFLFSTPAYASMGDISICFPFFLLLALLMAGMLAQGRSPLVGFDISLSKPPAEIKSTSYKFKSFTSGGFDTVAKARNEIGGGTHLTRGIGWVANKFAQGAGKAASAASGGKYGSKLAKEGSKFTRTMARSGALAAVTGGRFGGGYRGTLEKEKEAKDTKVKSLREQLGYSSAGKVNLVQAMSRVRELQNKKASGKKLKASETRELNKLRELVGARAIVRAKKKEVGELGARQAKTQKRIAELRGKMGSGPLTTAELSELKSLEKIKLTEKEEKRLKSLRTELGALEAKYAKATTRKSDLRNLAKQMHEARKKSDMYNVALTQLNKYVGYLDDIGGAKGRIKMMAYAPAAAAGFTYLGAKYPVASVKKAADKRKTRKELEKMDVTGKALKKRLTKDERKTLGTLRKKDPATLTTQEKDQLKKLNLRDRYLILSRPSALSMIFNPKGERKRDIAKVAAYRYGKRIFVATPWNLVKENIPANQLISTMLQSYTFKPGLEHKLASAEDKQIQIHRNIKILKDASSTTTQKRTALTDIKHLEKDLQKDMRTLDGRVVHRAILSGKADRLEKANKKIKEKTAEIEKLLKGNDPSKRKKIDVRIEQLKKLRADRDKLIFGDRAKIKEIDNEIDGINTELEKLRKQREKLVGKIESDKIGKHINDSVQIGKSESFEEDVSNVEGKMEKTQQKMRELEDRGMKGNAEHKKLADELRNLYLIKDPIKANILRSKDLESNISELRSKQTDILSKSVAITGELAAINKADKLTDKIDIKNDELKKKRNEIASFRIALKDASLPALKRLASEKRVKELQKELNKLDKEKDRLEKKRSKLEEKGIIPTRRLLHAYDKLGKADRWVSDRDLVLGSTKEESENLKDDWERQSSVGTARLVDTWRAKVNASKEWEKSRVVNGELVTETKWRRNPESLAIRGINFGKSGLEKTQEFRHIASTWENVIAPMLISIGREEAKKKNLMRLLGKEQEELQARQRKQKAWMSSGETVQERKNRLEKETEDAGKKVAELKVKLGRYERGSARYNKTRQQLDDKQKELENKRTELRDATAIIGHARTVADARMELSKTERNLGKLMDSFLVQDALLEARRLDYEQKEPGDKRTKDFKDKIKALERTWEEKARKTEIRVGGESILRDRDRLKSEITLAKAGALETPNESVVKMINNLGVSNKTADYYKQHKDEYLSDTGASYAKLKKKWDNLETVNVADWVRRKMDEAGDNRRGRESGLYREKLERTLVQSVNPEKFEKLSPANKEIIKENADLLDKKLYLATLEFGGVIDAATATKYDEKIKKIEEHRMNVRSFVEADIHDLELRIDMIKKGELKEAKEIGWAAEADRMKERVNELEAKKEVLENRLNELKTKPPTYKAIEHEERIKYNRMVNTLSTTTYMHKAAELLQREEYAESVGGLMQIETKNELELLRQKYPEDNTRFWAQANEWAGRIQKTETESLIDTYERDIVNKRKEIKDLSSRMQKIELKYDSVSSMSGRDREKYKELHELKKEKQIELSDTVKQWGKFRDNYRLIYEGPYRRSERWMGSGSEAKIESHLKEYAEEDVRNRLGIWRAVPERFAEPVSKAVESVTQFSTKHGMKVLLAATIAAPFAMPFIGIGAAAAIAGGSALTYGAKTGTRLWGDWKQSGRPFSSGDMAVTRMASKIADWSPHFTGRGSGAPAKTYADVWMSTMIGNEYITKGMRLDRYGRLQSAKSVLLVPQVGIPWFMHPAKTPLENIGTTAAYWAKRMALAMNVPGGYEYVRRARADNPSLIPEIQADKHYPYQFIQMYGSLEPVAFPKQAWEMTEYKAVALQFPYQEYAKQIIPRRSLSPTPFTRPERDRMTNMSPNLFPSIRDTVYINRMLRDSDKRRAAYDANKTYYSNKYTKY